MRFGTQDGETVERHVLSSTAPRAATLTYGAIIQSVEPPDGTNIVPSLPSPGDYLQRSRYSGACVGRYGNRIAPRPPGY